MSVEDHNWEKMSLKDIFLNRRALKTTEEKLAIIPLLFKNPRYVMSQYSPYWAMLYASNRHSQGGTVSDLEHGNLKKYEGHVTSTIPAWAPDLYDLIIKEPNFTKVLEAATVLVDTMHKTSSQTPDGNRLMDEGFFDVVRVMPLIVGGHPSDMYSSHELYRIIEPRRQHVFRHMAQRYLHLLGVDAPDGMVLDVWQKLRNKP